MSSFGAPDVSFFLVSGYDLLGKMVQTFTIEQSATLEETSGSGADAETWEDVGVSAGVVTQDGLLDDTALGNHEALKAVGGTPKAVAIAIGPNTIGSPVFLAYSAWAAVYKVGAAVKSLTKLAATYTLSKKGRYGAILHDLSAEAADGDTEASSVDDTADSAASSEGGIGVVQCTALDLDGYDDLTVKVSHSTDDIAFSDLITFTAIAAANVGEGKEVTGTVNRYLASEWAYTGAGSSPSVTFMVGFARLGEPAASP